MNPRGSLKLADLSLWANNSEKINFQLDGNSSRDLVKLKRSKRSTNDVSHYVHDIEVL